MVFVKVYGGVSESTVVFESENIVVFMRVCIGV